MTLGVDDIARIAYEVHRKAAKNERPPWKRLTIDGKQRWIGFAREAIELQDKAFPFDSGGMRIFKYVCIELRGYL